MDEMNRVTKMIYFIMTQCYFRKLILKSRLTSQARQVVEFNYGGYGFTVLDQWPKNAIVLRVPRYGHETHRDADSGQETTQALNHNNLTRDEIKEFV